MFSIRVFRHSQQCPLWVGSASLVATAQIGRFRTDLQTAEYFRVRPVLDIWKGWGGYLSKGAVPRRIAMNLEPELNFCPECEAQLEYESGALFYPNCGWVGNEVRVQRYEQSHDYGHGEKNP